MTFVKSKFTFSDGEEEFEGYTDGSIYNGWANVYFTKDQMKEVLDSMPYNYRFLAAGEAWNSHRTYPILEIYWEDNTEVIESSPIILEVSNREWVITDAYCMEGYEFVEVVHD